MKYSVNDIYSSDSDISVAALREARENIEKLSDEEFVQLSKAERSVAGDNSNDVVDEFERRMVGYGVPNEHGVTAIVMTDIASDETLKQFAERAIADYDELKREAL